MLYYFVPKTNSVVTRLAFCLRYMAQRCNFETYKTGKLQHKVLLLD
jgi:hypothetical protein